MPCNNNISLNIVLFNSHWFSLVLTLIRIGICGAAHEKGHEREQ